MPIWAWILIIVLIVLCSAAAATTAADAALHRPQPDPGAGRRTVLPCLLTQDGVNLNNNQAGRSSARDSS
jgi:hypothetical protein